MSKYIIEIDTFIDNAQEFAQPILNFLRNTVHEACPDCEEAIKWKYPHFMYRGKILCAMASFKQHCTFGFWLEYDLTLLKEATKDKEKDSIHSLGKIKSLEDLPSKQTLIAIIREAMELTDLGTKLKKAPPEKVEIETPKEFADALSRNPLVENIFKNAAPSFRKEYNKWIIDAKTDKTRETRISQALEWIAEKKGRNWKYEKR